MSIAIGGDETGAIVGDVGTGVSKFGFGGEDAPKCVMGSALGCVYEAGTDVSGPLWSSGDGAAYEALPPLSAESYQLPDDYPERLHVSSPWEEAAARDARPPPPDAARWFDGDVSELAARAMGGPEPCVVRRPLRDGQVEDWDAVEELWARGLSRLKSSGADHPVLCGYPSSADRLCRERYLELFFEAFGCDAVYLSRSATLAAFAAGRASALVVDCGAGSTSGQEKGDSMSLQRGCSRSDIQEKSIHALSSPKEMIARPKMSQIEWKTIEI